MSFTAIIGRADSAKPRLQAALHHFKIFQTADSLAGYEDCPAAHIEL